MKLHTLLPIISLCMGLTACGPDVFYIPIDNKLGNAKPLSKMEDTIRVIVPEKLTEYVAKARANGSCWLNDAMIAKYILIGKVNTERKLQALGYKFVDIGFHAGGGTPMS